MSALQSAQGGFSSDLTEDHFVTTVTQVQTGLECPHDPHWQKGCDVLLYDGESDDTVASSQTNWYIHNTFWLRHASNTTSGFWCHLAPFDVETMFREQFAPFFKLLFPDESLLCTSVPQDLSRVESDECPGSAQKRMDFVQ